MYRLFVFSNNPVNIDILLEFMGVLSIPEMQQLVATVIFEETPRYRYNDVVGHLVGDLLVYYADLLLYQDNTIFGKYNNYYRFQKIAAHGLKKCRQN